jgi:hypothetical protein
MKKLGAGLVVAAIFTLAGCNKDTGGTAKEKFSFTGPNRVMPTKIARGKSATIQLTIKKDKNFKGKIALQVADKPSDLDVTLDPTEVKESDGPDVNINMKVTAAKEAKEGKHTIKVTATPEHGSAASVPVDINVEK